MKKQIEQKLRNYSFLKNILRLITLIIAIIALIISIWSLVVSYQVKDEIKWLDDKQNHIIQNIMFKNADIDIDDKDLNKENRK